MKEFQLNSEDLSWYVKDVVKEIDNDVKNEFKEKVPNILKKIREIAYYPNKGNKSHLIPCLSLEKYPSSIENKDYSEEAWGSAIENSLESLDNRFNDIKVLDTYSEYVIYNFELQNSYNSSLEDDDSFIFTDNMVGDINLWKVGSSKLSIESLVLWVIYLEASNFQSLDFISVNEEELNSFKEEVIDSTNIAMIQVLEEVDIYQNKLKELKEAQEFYLERLEENLENYESEME